MQILSPPKASLQFLWTQPETRGPASECQEFPSVPVAVTLQKQMLLTVTHSVQHTFIKHLLSTNHYAKYWTHSEPQSPHFNVGHEEEVNELQCDMCNRRL